MRRGCDEPGGCAADGGAVLTGVHGQAGNPARVRPVAKSGRLAYASCGAVFLARILLRIGAGTHHGPWTQRLI